MKQVISITILSLCIFTSCITNSGVSEAFSKYSREDGVTSVSVPGWLIGIAANFGDLSDDEQEFLESIDKVKVLSVENDELNSRINFHEEFNSKINKNGDYEELLTVNSEGENITIFGIMTENVIKEMVVLIGGDDNVMVYLKGEIRPELINNVASLSKSDNFLSFR